MKASSYAENKEMLKANKRSCAACGKTTDDPSEEDSRVWYGPGGEGPFCSAVCRKTLPDRPSREEVLLSQRDEARRAWARQVAITRSSHGYEVAKKQWGLKEARRLFPYGATTESTDASKFHGEPQTPVPEPPTNPWVAPGEGPEVTPDEPLKDVEPLKLPPLAASHIVCRACGHSTEALVQWKLAVGDEATCPSCEVGRADAVSGVLPSKHGDLENLNEELSSLRDVLLQVYEECWAAYKSQDSSGLAVTALRLSNALLRVTEATFLETSPPEEELSLKSLQKELRKLQGDVSKLKKAMRPRTGDIRFR